MATTAVRSVVKTVEHLPLAPLARDPVFRIYVWELPVRIAHWIFVVAIAVLAFTGWYVHAPFLPANGKAAWTMGTIRYIHILTGFIFTAAVFVRAYWFFIAGNEWARWRQFFPVEGRRFEQFKETVKYYFFIRHEPVAEIGHNPLASSAYAAVFGLFTIEILTGFALLNDILGNRVLGFFIGWLPRLVSIQYLRATHFFVMFLFGAFLIHHVYSAILISWEEKSGLMESIVTGYKFLSKKELDEIDRRRL
jgi:Ni/Fe-hydrogenase 1 B-type cytochrome subunit